MDDVELLKTLAKKFREIVGDAHPERTVWHVAVRTYLGTMVEVYERIERDSGCNVAGEK